MLFFHKKFGMKSLAAAAFCCAVAAVSAADISCLPEPKIPRHVKLDDKKPLTLVRDGAVNFELVVPSDASAPAKYAGDVAAKFLSQALGQKIAVRDAASGKVPAIVIGDRKLAAKNGIDVAKFDRDGFVIRTTGDQILIVGRDTEVNPQVIITAFGDKGEIATVFGVEDFLERFAGVRFYFPTELGTIIPRMKDWSVPQIDIYDRPDYIQRRFVDVQKTFPNYYGADLKGWRDRGRKQQFLWTRRETIQMPHCHGLGQVGLQRRFGKTHPEYFAMDSVGKRRVGQKYTDLCYSSGIRDEIFADAKAFLTGRPASERDILDWKGKSGWQFHHFPHSLPCYDIMPDDCMFWCQCEKCRDKVTPEQQADFMWSVFVEIAGKLKAEGVPGYVTTMAYGQYRRIPSVDIPDNLLVMLAIRGPWNELTPDVRDAETELLKAWHKKIGRKVYLWVYPGKYPHVRHQGGWPDIPHTTPRVMASFFKRTRDHVSGVYCENDSDRGIYNYLTNYVCGKVMWNLDADIDAILAEHAQLMFGPAAKEMQEFFESVERNWMKIAANAKMGPAGPETIYPSELDLWNKVYTVEEVARLNKLFAQAKKLCAKSPEHLARVEVIEKEMWLPTVRAADVFRKSMDASANWKAQLKTADGAITIDGKLDDPAWGNAETVFLSPVKDADPAEVRTRVKMLCDKDNYYFAFDCEEPFEAVAVERSRDDKGLYTDSTVELFLSPDRHPERYYQWMVTPLGCWSDLCRPRGVRSQNSREESLWNSHAEIKTSVVPGKGWTAEIRIPRADLPAASPEGIKADFCRHRNVKNAKIGTAFYSWSPNARHFGDIDRFGTLTFTPDTRVNLLPEKDFDFRRPVGQDKRFCGKWGCSNAETGFLRDEKFFVSGGASARLEGPERMDITCSVKLKPDTEYVLSFYCRMQDVQTTGRGGSTFGAYIFDGSGRHLVLPEQYALRGTCPWTRIECRFRTSPDAGKKSQIAGFLWRKAQGTAWVDHVELYEADGK